MNTKNNHALMLCLPLLGLLPIALSAAPRPASLDARSVAGYYITEDKHAIYQSFSIQPVGLPAQDRGGIVNFTGQYGGFSLVGQAILTGGTNDCKYPPDQIEFDFMYMEPQDETLMLHSQSLMRAGKVVGLIIREAGTSSDGQKFLPVRYLRVSKSVFAQFLRTHPQ